MPAEPPFKRRRSRRLTARDVAELDGILAEFGEPPVTLPELVRLDAAEAADRFAARQPATTTTPDDR